MLDANTNTQSRKKIHIETWGCQMNVADSEQMLGLMQKENYELVDSAEDADLILLNTCHIREKANNKIRSRVGVLKKLKKENPDLTLALAGCVAQAENRTLLGDLKAVDIVLGPGKLGELPQLVKDHKQKGERGMAVGFYKDGQKNIEDLEEAVSDQPSLTGRNEVSRFVNIQQGCNNYCAFCVVPHTRGREISRHPERIVTQVKSLVDSGCQEITLLGQNVNSYGLDLVESNGLETTADGPFVDLLRRASEVPGLKRLRFTTSNPHDFTEPLANLFSESPVFGKYIHLPVQSGSNSILEKMKRKVTVEEFYQRVHWLRRNVSDMAISTDLIVGFPGETDEDFEATCELVRNVRFSFIFAFMYSPRAKTPAARFKEQVPDEVKAKRLYKLNEIQDQITIEENRKEIGQTREVLFLYESKKEPHVYYGRTDHFRLVRVNSQEDLTGQLLHAKIIDGNKTALVGELV